MALGVAGTKECVVRLKRPHAAQLRFLRSTARRRALKCGRRSGKTTGLAILSVEEFLKGERVQYFAPTAEQLLKYWGEVTAALYEPIAAGIFRKNETLHLIELPGTEQCIRAKTAWEPNHLRGDYGSVLILDEYGLFSARCWDEVISPMTLDRDAMVTFAFTPPSLRTIASARVDDPQHAVKLFKTAAADTSGRWAAIHFSSYENPFLSQTALADITQDMSSLAYRQEILAEDLESLPGALWNRELLERQRVQQHPPLKRIVIGLDPGYDAGIVAAGLGEDGMAYVLEDLSISGVPDVWASQAITGFHKYHANFLVAERNHGADMVKNTLHHIDRSVTVREVWASHGKYARAEPISVLYEQGKVWHVGRFDALEDELCTWLPGSNMPSPNRLDSCVWALTELMPAMQQRAGAWGR